jgi:hypothetical protein
MTKQGFENVDGSLYGRSLRQVSAALSNEMITGPVPSGNRRGAGMTGRSL